MSHYFLIPEVFRERYEALLHEAERDRLVRANGLQRGVDALVRERLLRWAVALHRRLHEEEAARTGEAFSPGRPAFELEATGELNHGAEVSR